MPPSRTIRQAPPPAGSAQARHRAVPKSKRGIEIRAGQITLTARLLDTPTALRIWYALPIWSTAEIWGHGALHFKTHIETGRERSAQWNVTAGQIAYWVEDDCIIIGYGMTPISLRGEIRLPSPGNIFAQTGDDVTRLQSIIPGTRIDVTAIII